MSSGIWKCGIQKVLEKFSYFLLLFESKDHINFILSCPYRTEYGTDAGSRF